MMDKLISQMEPGTAGDRVANMLASGARLLVVLVIGLLPVLFIPVSYIPQSVSKVFFITAIAAIAVIFFALYTLRSGELSGRFSIYGVAIVPLAALVFLSAILSGDSRDALIGDVMNVHTALFVVLMMVVYTLGILIARSRSSVMHVYLLLAGSSLVLGLFHIFRFIFGSDALTLGIFSATTDSPIGSWNDVGLFFGLVVLLSLVAVEQLPLTLPGRSFFVLTTLIALFMLAVVNFTAVWVVLGLAGLVMLMYNLVKHRLAPNNIFQTEPSTIQQIIPIGLSLVTFLVAVLFVVGGSSLSNAIGNMTGVSYVEVRPSFQATVDIGRGVYETSALFGIGPNRFADAWRLHKDQAINETIFWNTPFDAGIGYIPSFAVTAGVAGLFGWLLFLGSLLYMGVRIMFYAGPLDRFWQFIGVSSFVSVVYLWGLSFLYVPGPVILLIAALCSGLVYACYAVRYVRESTLLSLTRGTNHLFGLVVITMIIIVGSVGTLYGIGRQYAGLVTFGSTVSSIDAGTDIASVEERIATAYSFLPSDRFAREIAGLQISKMQALLALAEPNEAQQVQFQSSVGNAINAAELAVSLDGTDPRNWVTLGTVYGMLAAAQVEGALARAQEAFATARTFDPLNPEIVLLEAQLAGRTGDTEAARAKTNEAIALKSNYTDAYSLLAQIDIASGDTAAAIAATQASITLDPNNPARYYQLGVLYLSTQKYREAVEVLEVARSRNASYANARYVLALAYDALNQTDAARAELEAVAELNPENEIITEALRKLDDGEALIEVVTPTSTVTEPVAVRNQEGGVTTTEDPNSSLVTPINPVPEGSDDEEESQDEEVEDGASDS